MAVSMNSIRAGAPRATMYGASFGVRVGCMVPGEVRRLRPCPTLGADRGGPLSPIAPPVPVGLGHRFPGTGGEVRTDDPTVSLAAPVISGGLQADRARTQS